LVLSALFLASCSTAAEPTTLATPTAEAPTTATAVEATPSPTAVESDPDRGAPSSEPRQLVEAYIQAANESLSRSDSLPGWRELFADSCSLCLSGYENAQRIHEQGLSASGGALVDWVIADEQTTASSSVLVVTGVLEPATVRAPDGTIAETYDRVDPLTVVYSAEVDDVGVWRVVGARILT